MAEQDAKSVIDYASHSTPVPFPKVIFAFAAVSIGLDIVGMVIVGVLVLACIDHAQAYPHQENFAKLSLSVGGLPTMVIQWLLCPVIWIGGTRVMRHGLVGRGRLFHGVAIVLPLLTLAAFMLGLSM